MINVFLLIGLTSDNDNCLKLILLEVFGTKRHDEALDCRVDAADYDMVLDFWVVLERS